MNSTDLLRLGDKFQDFAVNETESGEPVLLSDILPNGGVILYMPSNYLWLDLNLNALTKTAYVPRRREGQNVVLLTAGTAVPALVAEVRSRRIDLPIYNDFTGVLRDVCHVPDEPVFFRLDGQFRLQRAGFLGASPKAYERSLE